MVIDSFNLLAFFETKNVMVVIQISCGVLGVQVCTLRIGHMGSIRRYNGFLLHVILWEFRKPTVHCTSENIVFPPRRTLPEIEAVL